MVKRSAFVAWPVLDSGSRGLGSSQCVVFLCRTLYYLSTQEYKWVPEISQGNLMKCQEGRGRGGGGGNHGVDCHHV